jgi:hypothetical protein
MRNSSKLGSVAIACLLVAGAAAPVAADDAGLNADVYVYGFDGVPQRSTSLYPECTANGVIAEVQTLENLFGAPFQEVIVAGCQSDYVLVHLTGYITLDSGNYTFNFSADDGLFLSIGGQVLTTDAIDWIIKPPDGSTNVSFRSDGYSQEVDYWFFENRFGSYADVEILDSRGVEVVQEGLFSKTPKRLPVVAPSYEGPLDLALRDVTKNCQPATWQLTGKKLDGIKQITIAGKPAVIVSSSSSLIQLQAPAGLAPGRHRVEYSVPGSNLSLYDFLVVRTERVCAETLKISGFASGSSALTAVDVQKIRQMVSARSAGQNQLVCVGSASYSEPTARTVARARAQAACRLAAPGMRATTYISVSSSADSAVRAVTVKLATSR